MSGLKPFEVEMRRRLWYQIIMLDILCAQQSGCSGSSTFRPTSCMPPSNVNDADIGPDMEEPVRDREVCAVPLHRIALAA